MPDAMRRWIGALAIAVAAAVVVILATRRAPHVAPVVKKDAGAAAVRAPAAPVVPAQLAGGTKLTGFVVDGAGLPVVGAEVTAELEKGAPDTALAGMKHFFVEQGGNFTHDPMRSIADSAEYVKRVLFKKAG